MKDEITELRELCADIRKFIQEERLSEAKEKIALGMAQHPDAGIPHNLMGIVKEIENDRVGAMKHFRSAYALDPKNTSIRKNIDSLCAFRLQGKSFCLEMKMMKGKKEATLLNMMNRVLDIS